MPFGGRGLPPLHSQGSRRISSYYDESTEATDLTRHRALPYNYTTAATAEPRMLPPIHGSLATRPAPSPSSASSWSHQEPSPLPDFSTGPPNRRLQGSNYSSILPSQRIQEADSPSFHHNNRSLVPSAGNPLSSSSTPTVSAPWPPPDYSANITYAFYPESNTTRQIAPVFPTPTSAPAFTSPPEPPGNNPAIFSPVSYSTRPATSVFTASPPASGYTSPLSSLRSSPSPPPVVEPQVIDPAVSVAAVAGITWPSVHWLLRLPPRFWDRMGEILPYQDILRLALLSSDFNQVRVEQFVPWDIRRNFVHERDNKPRVGPMARRRQACYLCYTMKYPVYFQVLNQETPEFHLYVQVLEKNPYTGSRRLRPLNGYHNTALGNQRSFVTSQYPSSWRPNPPGAEVGGFETLRRYCIECGCKTGLYVPGDLITRMWTTARGEKVWICRCMKQQDQQKVPQCPTCHMTQALTNHRSNPTH